MNLIFIGPQGSGKGTQAKKVAEKFGLCHISTGDLLRATTGDLRAEVDSYIDGGNLVPDELIIKILEKRLKDADCEKGFILDGFPRNVSQAEKLEEIVDIDKVVEIALSDETAVKRILGRRNCGKCGAIFNVYTFRPKVEDVCDECGGELFSRVDDTEEALRERLRVYHEETEPVLERYTSVKIDGEKSVEACFEDVLGVLS